MGEYEQAIKLFKRALEIYPGHEKSLYNMALAYIKSEKWEKALYYADLLNFKFYHENYLNLKGFILIKQNRPGDAIPDLVKALRIAPYSHNVSGNLAAAFTLIGKHEEADKLLRKINRIYPNDIKALFYLIENSLRAENMANANKYIEKLFATFSVGDIKSSVVNASVYSTEIPYSPVLLAAAVAERLNQKAQGLNLTISKNEPSKTD